MGSFFVSVIVSYEYRSHCHCYGCLPCPPPGWCANKTVEAMFYGHGCFACSGADLVALSYSVAVPILFPASLFAKSLDTTTDFPLLVAKTMRSSCPDVVVLQRNDLSTTLHHRSDADDAKLRVSQRWPIQENCNDASKSRMWGQERRKEHMTKHMARTDQPRKYRIARKMSELQDHNPLLVLCFSCRPRMTHPCATAPCMRPPAS